MSNDTKTPNPETTMKNKTYKNQIRKATCPECGDSDECGEFHAKPRGMRPGYFYVWCPVCGHVHRTVR